MKRIIALGAAVTLLSLPAMADDVGGGNINVPSRPGSKPMMSGEAPVTAAPPPFVSLESTSIAAGVGISWGDGTLNFEGRPYAFALKGLTLGELGASTASAVGDVSNLERVSDFEGTYVAMTAGGAVGVGASALTMRNEHGVVISLRSDLRGVQLSLGAEGLSVELR